MRILKIIMLCYLASSCQERNDYKIIGNVKGIPDSAVVDLYIDYADIGERIASDTVIEGKFNFTDTVGDEIQQMRLFMRDMQNYPGSCNLWVGKGDIHVTGESNFLASWKVNSSIQEQRDENRIAELTRTFRVKIDSLDCIQTEHRKNNIDDRAEIRKQIDSLENIKNKIELNYLAEHYNSKVAVIHLCNLAQFGDSLEKNQIRNFYTKIDTTYLNTLWGEGIENYINMKASPGIGDKFVNFKAFDIHNKPHHLADFTGKYILLDFWSSGCYPCIMSIPELRRISESYKKVLTVISVNSDTQKKFWLSATKRDTITWINLSDGKGTFGGANFLYGINGFPTYALINPEGFIIDKWMGYGQGSIEEKLTGYLGKMEK